MLSDFCGRICDTVNAGIVIYITNIKKLFCSSTYQNETLVVKSKITTEVVEAMTIELAAQEVRKW